MNSTVLLDAGSNECRESDGPRDRTKVVQGVGLAASVVTTGKRIVAGRGEYVATVSIETSESLEVVVGTPGGSEQRLTQALGDVCIIGPRSTMEFPTSSCEIIQYRIPAIVIRNVAAQWKLVGIDSLKCPVVCQDRVLHHLSRVMSTLLEHPRPATSRIEDYFANSFYAHLLQQYGVRSGGASEYTGGLSPRHKRVVDSIFSAPLPSDLSNANVARLCNLSTGHFARAFRQTFGRTFHQHVTETRIERAKELLQGSQLSIAEIARESGYADQATFTESFRRASGISPGRYRRQHMSGEERWRPWPDPQEARDLILC